MSIVLVQRKRRKLRKSLAGNSGPKSPKSKGAQEIIEPCYLDVRENDELGVVRVGYTIRPRHADLISNILATVRRATGGDCSASDVVRFALDEVSKLPAARIIEMLSQQESVKRGRRS